MSQPYPLYSVGPAVSGFPGASQTTTDQSLQPYPPYSIGPAVSGFPGASQTTTDQSLQPYPPYNSVGPAVSGFPGASQTTTDQSLHAEMSQPYPPYSVGPAVSSSPGASQTTTDQSLHVGMSQPSSSTQQTQERSSTKQVISYYLGIMSEQLGTMQNTVQAFVRDIAKADSSSEDGD